METVDAGEAERGWDGSAAAAEFRADVLPAGLRAFVFQKRFCYLPVGKYLRTFPRGGRKL